MLPLLSGVWGREPPPGQGWRGEGLTSQQVLRRRAVVVLLEVSLLAVAAALASQARVPLARLEGSVVSRWWRRSGWSQGWWAPA